LNLACANRVILMEPWWNHAIELQAFGRVFRIGQEKHTYFLSLIAQDTIDERVWNLQNEKKEAIEKGFVQSLQGNKDPEYASLLGHVTEDKDGKKVVKADYRLDVD
jgi:SNF2 family DNA or RNA helicase